LKTLPLLLVCIAVVAARADLAADLLGQLKNEIKAEAKVAREKGDNDSGPDDFHRMQEMLIRLQQSAAEESGRDAGMLQAVEAIAAVSHSEKIDGICQALATELRGNITRKEEALSTELEKTLGEALRTTLAAKHAKDVDAPLIAIGKLAHQSEAQIARAPKLRALAAQVQQLLEFLRRWQDYLSDAEAGDIHGARQILTQLSSSSRDFSGLMPRSELLARLNEVQKASGIVKETLPVSPQELETKAREFLRKAKTLEDLAPTLAELERLTAAGGGVGSSALSSAILAVRTMHRAHEELKKGLAVNISVASLASGSSSGDEEVLAALRGQLLLFALPRLLGLPAAEHDTKSDNVLTFLQRTLEAARNKEDWGLAGRVMDVAQTVNLSAVAVAMDRIALQSFLAARNQERARQFPLAVASYQAALKSGSQIIPAEKIGERLEAIRKDHPAEFDQGIQLALAPPVQPESRFPGRSAYPYGASFPGRPNAAEPPPVLSVPAVKKKEAGKSAAATDSAKGQ